MNPNIATVTARAARLSRLRYTHNRHFALAPDPKSADIAASRYERKLAHRAKVAARIEAAKIAVAVPAGCAQFIGGLTAGFGYDRGAYNELLPCSVADPKHREVSIAALRHPVYRLFQLPLDIIARAQSKGVIADESLDFDRKGFGTAVNIDLYGFNKNGLVIVQVRTTTRTKYGNSPQKSYFITDGRTSQEVSANKVRRAINNDPSIDSALRAVRADLPLKWQRRISKRAVSLAVPQTLYRAYKVLARNEAGQLVSVYDDSPYILGKWRREKAKDDHGGGFYVYLSEDEAIAAARGNSIFNTAWTNGKTLVLWEVEAGGTFIEYGSGKHAFSQVRLVREIGPVSHA